MIIYNKIDMVKWTGSLLSCIFLVSFSHATDDEHTQKVKNISQMTNSVSKEEREKFEELFEKNRNPSQKPIDNKNCHDQFVDRKLYNSEGRLIITETH